MALIHSKNFTIQISYDMYLYGTSIYVNTYEGNIPDDHQTGPLLITSLDSLLQERLSYFESPEGIYDEEAVEEVEALLTLCHKWMAKVAANCRKPRNKKGKKRATP